MSTSLPFQKVAGEPLSLEQQNYLEGLFAGLRNKGFKFSDVEPEPEAATPKIPENLIFEERVKGELHPLDAYELLQEHASASKAPERENVFRFKWNGLFYLTPKKEAFMARLRIPAGQLKSFQLRELARIADTLTSGYIQVTTRSNLQMRLIQMKDAPEFLRRVQSIGLHTRGSGADNIRNITADPTFGIDPDELFDVGPLCEQLGQIIINNREFYDLPRKFNIAFDGGGAIGSLEDTNDIGVKAVRVLSGPADVPPGIYFQIKLGGATGHKAFAEEAGVLVKPEQVLKVVVALLRVYIANGNRTDRKKARLKHLLETWSLDKYLEETEKPLGSKLPRGKGVEVAPSRKEKPHSHIGVYPQKQKGLNYFGIAIPVGQLTSRQLVRLAEIADLYGSGEVRLTVWQTILLPNVPDAFVATVKKALIKIGFDWRQSNLRSGLVACTGNSYCKFASANTKGHALELASYLEKRVNLDLPVNIHLTGCPNSCAQHYIGDIGLLGTTTKVSGETLEAYHVFVGGGFGENKAIGRQVFHGISVEQLKPTLERMLRAYLKHREGNESFQSFTLKRDLKALQDLFSAEG